MMLLSWLLYYTLLIGFAPTGSCANAESNVRREVGSSAMKKPRTVIWERVEYVVVEREAQPKRVILERISEVASTPRQGAAQVLRTPEPTAAPQKRQDTGQIQALSGQVAQLSVSIAAISSASRAISQASQSISQSAQQAIQSANQQADQASSSLSRSVSSASSAVLQASQQADSRVAQASASFNSQISVNLASVQSSASASASSAIALVRDQASSSMSSAFVVAASQVQAARADATAVAGNANNFADQIQRNAVSTTNLAIIVSVSVSGAVILTSVVACVFLRYRRKRRNRGLVKDKDYEKPIAVRGSVGGGSRFNPWAGGTYAMDKLKLPGFTPRMGKKPEPLNFGFATSDYSDLKNEAIVDVKEPVDVPREARPVSSTSLRLQKPPNVKKAETLRLIRVNSKKSQDNDEDNAQRGPPQQARKTAQAGPEPPKADRQSEVPRSDIRTDSQPPKAVRQSQAQPDIGTDRQPPRQSMAEAKLRENLRYSVASDVSETLRDDRRYTATSTSNDKFRESKRYTAASSNHEEPGWRPPNPGGRTSTMTTAQRLAFRDSADTESEEPGWKPRSNAFSMASVSTLMRPNQPGPTAAASRPPPKKTGPSFATFPTVRQGPPSMLNRPRPGPPKKSVETSRDSADIFTAPG